MNTDGKVWLMLHFAKRTPVLLTALLLSWSDVFAQLGSTNLDGLQIKVVAIYRSGDSRDMDCTVGIQFSGDKVDRAISMSKVTVFDAADDTGKSLLRTNQTPGQNDSWLSSKHSDTFYSSVGNLKSPANEAKTIKRLSGSVQFFAPNETTPVFTNFMANPGRPLTHPALTECQVAITYERPVSDTPPGSLVLGDKTDQTVTLKVEDVHNRIVRMAFQKPDGGILPASQQVSIVNGKRTAFTYVFKQAPPRDLNLVVYVSEPEPSDTIAFTLEDIRLPWVDSPDFTVSVESAKLQPARGTNARSGSLILSFSGGPMTNALGVRKLWIHQAKDNLRQPVKIGWSGGQGSLRFDAQPFVATGNGRRVQKYVPTTFQSPDPAAIRVLRGEAELVFPGTNNSHMTIIKDFQRQVGEPFDLPLLQTNHVQITFLGAVNYAGKRAEFMKSRSVAQHGNLQKNETAADFKNSLLFSLNDPEQAVITPWGDEQITVLDDHGNALSPDCVMTSGEFLVYRFKTLPPAGSQLRISMALPGSLQRVPFKLENIPLR